MVRQLRELQYILEYVAIWPLIQLARALPDRGAQALIDVITRLAYWILIKDRRWAFRNLELVFGDNLDSAERRRIVLESFKTIVRTRIECLRWSEDWMVRHIVEEGGEAGRQLRQKCDANNQGIIFITGHLGNFELLPAYCHYGGVPSTVMYRPQNNWRVERLILGARRDYLPNAVQRSATGMIALGYVLREGGNAGLLVDMNTLDNPVFVDFLGYKAASPPGAAALALSTGAPVVLAVSVRQPDGKYRMIFHPPFTTIRTGNKKQDIIANTQQYMKAIEGYVLAFPEQYNWPHPRWRYRPDGSYWTLSESSAKQALERQRPPMRTQDDPTPLAIRQSQLPPVQRAA